jgi:hypothetical protein
MARDGAFRDQPISRSVPKLGTGRTWTVYALCGLWELARIKAGRTTGAFWSQPRNEKGPRVCKPLDCLARPAGFEPTTPWFVAAKMEMVSC